MLILLQDFSSLSPDVLEDSLKGFSASNLKIFSKLIQEDYSEYIYDRMIHALRHGYPKILELSLLFGIDPNHRNASFDLYEKNYTPLHMAVKSGNIETIKILLEYKADPNIKTGLFNETALDIVCEHHDRPDILDLLLKYGARDTGKSVALSINGDKYESAEFLIDKGFDVNGRLGMNTTLHLATLLEYPNIYIIEKLLKAGSMYGIREAINTAKRRNHIDLVELLEKYRK